MSNVKQLGVVPVGKRLSDAEIQILTAAGFEVKCFISRHFTATRERDGVSFDSRSVVGDQDPVSFTLRAIAAHIEQSARQLLEGRLEQKVIERWTGDNA